MIRSNIADIDYLSDWSQLGLYGSVVEHSKHFEGSLQWRFPKLAWLQNVIENLVSYGVLMRDSLAVLPTIVLVDEPLFVFPN